MIFIIEIQEIVRFIRLILILVWGQPTIPFGTNASSHTTIHSNDSSQNTIYYTETQANRLCQHTPSRQTIATHRTWRILLSLYLIYPSFTILSDRIIHLATLIKSDLSALGDKCDNAEIDERIYFLKPSTIGVNR